jgi:hypothetical protein
MAVRGGKKVQNTEKMTLFGLRQGSNLTPFKANLRTKPPVQRWWLSSGAPDTGCSGAIWAAGWVDPRSAPPRGGPRGVDFLTAGQPHFCMHNALCTKICTIFAVFLTVFQLFLLKPSKTCFGGQKTRFIDFSPITCFLKKRAFFCHFFCLWRAFFACGGLFF